MVVPPFARAMSAEQQRFGAAALSMRRRSESQRAGPGSSRFGAAALSMRRRSESQKAGLGSSRIGPTAAWRII